MANFQEYSAIDLGCGRHKHEGALGVDIVETNDVDIVIDLNQYPWDLPDNSFSTVYCKDTLEHLDRPLRFLEEVYRISADDAIVHIKTPHFTNNNAWVDPTHKRPFSAFTFQDYITDEGEYSYYTDATFEPLSVDIQFESVKKLPWNLLGRYIANKWTWWYEKTVLRSVFPAQSMRIELRVSKSP
jgi:ubiquinone/menaquinone biosynthesis C-methylase UbiE